MGDRVHVRHKSFLWLAHAGGEDQGYRPRSSRERGT